MSFPISYVSDIFFMDWFNHSIIHPSKFPTRSCLLHDLSTLFFHILFS